MRKLHLHENQYISHLKIILEINRYLAVPIKSNAIIIKYLDKIKINTLTGIYFKRNQIL